MCEQCYYRAWLTAKLSDPVRRRQYNVRQAYLARERRAIDPTKDRASNKRYRDKHAEEIRTQHRLHQRLRKKKVFVRKIAAFKSVRSRRGAP